MVKICHFWDGNYYHLIFNDSTPSYVEKIMEGILDKVKTINCQLMYYLMVLFLSDPHLRF